MTRSTILTVASIELESITEYLELFEAIEAEILQKADSIWKNAPLPFKECAAYKTITALPADKKVIMLRALMYRTNETHRLTQKKSVFHSADLKKFLSLNGELSDATINKMLRANKLEEHRSNLENIDCILLWKLFAGKLEFEEGFAFSGLFLDMYGRRIAIKDRPFVGFVNQIEKHVNQYGAYSALVSEVQIILSDVRLKPYTREGQTWYTGEPDLDRSIAKLGFLIFGH